MLRELEGLSYREIGEKMELTRPAVESTLFRARRRLQREYEDLDTGARCAAITLSIARLAEGIESGRERSRVARHLRRCPGCRHRARELGVCVRRRSLVAALFPLPFLLRRRRGEGGADSASASVHTGSVSLQQVAGTWAPTVAGPGADATAGTLGKAAALVLTAALAGSGAVAVQHRMSPTAPTRDGGAATREAGETGKPAKAPDKMLSTRSNERSAAAAPGTSTPARKQAGSGGSHQGSGGGAGFAPGVPPLDGSSGGGSGGSQLPQVQPVDPIPDGTGAPPDGSTIPAPPSAQGQNGSHRTETPSAGDQGTATDRPLATISSTVQPNPEG